MVLYDVVHKEPYGLFTNYVYKMRQVGGSENVKDMQIFPFKCKGICTPISQVKKAKILLITVFFEGPPQGILISPSYAHIPLNQGCYSLQLDSLSPSIQRSCRNLLSLSELSLRQMSQQECIHMQIIWYVCNLNQMIKKLFSFKNIQK